MLRLMPSLKRANHYELNVKIIFITFLLISNQVIVLAVLENQYNSYKTSIR